LPADSIQSNSTILCISSLHTTLFFPREYIYYIYINQHFKKKKKKNNALLFYC
jgi:hypothetical protein